jgi:signal peptidase I
MRTSRILSIGFLISICAIVYFWLPQVLALPRVSDYLTEQGLGKPVLVPVSGTGSMYPTFPKGKSAKFLELSEEIVATPSMYLYPTGFVIFDKRYYQQPVAFGDIVSFRNEQTKQISTARTGEEYAFVKRVIGLAGDVLELRNGIVYRNREPLKEPYVAVAQSTFGGNFLHECREITVPNDSVFVMGDNRKGSNDSRHEIGFVRTADVTSFIPFEKQLGVYDALWRDSTKDLEPSARIKINKTTLMKLINDQRRSQTITPLKYNDKLDMSARKRGTRILEDNDFSFEATKSGYTMAKSLAETGYRNILSTELPIQGYYDAEELYALLFQFSSMRELLMNSESQDFGIAEVQGSLNGCPTQVIVIHVGGYRPPNYSAEVIESWKKSLSSLSEALPGWEKMRTEGEFYEQNTTDIERMIEIFEIRIKNVESIVSQMEENEYLTDEQEAYIEKEAEFNKEQDAIVGKLNSVE